MKKILKKSLLILLLLVIVFPTTILTACKKDEKAQEFYDYAVTAKAALDNLADETTTVMYTVTYNPYGIDLEVFTNLSKATLDKKRAVVKNDYTTLSELCDNTQESSLHVKVKTVFYAFEDYANCVFKMEGSYSSFTSKKELYERELRDSLLELELALS